MVNPIEKGKEAVARYVFQYGMKKLAKRAAALVVAFAAAKGLSQYGVDVGDPEKVAAGIFLFLEGGRDYLKRRFPAQFGWL